MLDLKLHRIRRPTLDDVGFMVVSWTAEAIRAPTFQHMNRDLAFKLLRPHILDHLKRLWDSIWIVCPSSKDEPIEAFGVMDGPILMYLHVRGSFRRQGLATGLLNYMINSTIKGPLVVATDTRDVRSIIKNNRHDIVIRTDLLPIQDRRDI